MLLAVAISLSHAPLFTHSAAAQGIGKPNAPSLNTTLVDTVPFPSQMATLQSLPAPRRKMSTAQRRTRLVLGVGEHGAALFDARTTRDAMQEYRELNLFLRPFAHSPMLYPAMQVAPFGFDWLAGRFATCRNGWLRRLWWLPQAAAAAGFIWSGTHNLRLPTSPGVVSH